MSQTDTPSSSKKRDPTSPLSDPQHPQKKTKPFVISCDQDSESDTDTDTDSEFEMAEPGDAATCMPAKEVTGDKVIQMSLQEADLVRLSAMLKQVMVTEVKDLVKEVVAGVSDAIHLEVNQLRSDVAELRQENDQLKARVSELETSADAIEQYTRRNSVRITGIPEEPGESTDELVLKVSKDMKAGITRFDLDRTHRVGKPAPDKTRAIIVKFATYNARRRFMDKRKTLKSVQDRKSVFINEDLTVQRNKLLYQARQLVKSKELEGAWSADGKIFVKTHTGKKGMITSVAELDQFTTGN